MFVNHYSRVVPRPDVQVAHARPRKNTRLTALARNFSPASSLPRAHTMIELPPILENTCKDKTHSLASVTMCMCELSILLIVNALQVYDTYNRYSSSYCFHSRWCLLTTSHDAWYFNEMPASVKMASSCALPYNRYSSSYCSRMLSLQKVSVNISMRCQPL